MTVSVPRESVEKLACTISTDTDPTALAVRFAFTQGTARPSTWTAGTWQGTATLAGGRYTATALTPIIGTGGIVLAVGLHNVWVHLDGASEDPVMPAGTILIT